MFGHLWEGYERDGQFCGYEFSRKYDLAEKLDTPIFTPSTKAAQGHDEYVSVDDFLREEGTKLGEEVKDISLKLYEICYDYAYKRGLIIADVKFEFGLDEDNNLVLGDELFTPDSSRFWSLKDYKVGTSPKSYDKQFVRDWLQDNKKDGKMQFDKVPDDVFIKTSQIYRECLRIVTDDCKR
jgi:phosphoribosylaminoimidazole-succinocarboxamide synthase